MIRLNMDSPAPDLAGGDHGPGYPRRSYRGKPVHSYRCDDEVWAAADRRARQEGRTVAQVVVEHLRQYGSTQG